ncbi:MAG: hypothetical protein PUE01_00015 [Clostridiaceae bacterium]|nr:hypothetical protein [Clostridiaceae bacterium]
MIFKSKKFIMIISATVIAGITLTLGYRYILKDVFTEIVRNIQAPKSDDKKEENEDNEEDNNIEANSTNIDNSSEKKSTDKSTKKEEDKTQKAARDKASKSKVEPKKDSKVAEDKIVKEVTPNDNLYVNKKLGFSLQFPDSWQGKYRIDEDEYGIEVCMYGGYMDGADVWGTFFTITKDNGQGLINYLAKIDGVEKCTKLNGETFYVGGPLQLSEKKEWKYYDLYSKMVAERADILKTLKEC